ncbi:MAG: Ketosteroid isomerase-like protein [Acidobacteria bacterium]|nr:Ketosteroid isomerase-like protein [Acidobacteriota bacterium]
MLMRFLRVLVVIGAVAAAGCGGAQAPALDFGKEDAAQIRQLVADFTAAYNARDVQKLSSLYSGNAILMPPNRTTLRGQEMVKSYFESRVNEEGATDLSFGELSLDGQGTLAYVFATYDLKLRPASGPEERYRGKNLWIARKLGGQWRFELEMMSSDLPPAAPPAPAAEGEKK